MEAVSSIMVFYISFFFVQFVILYIFCCIDKNFPFRMPRMPRMRRRLEYLFKWYTLESWYSAVKRPKQKERIAVLYSHPTTDDGLLQNPVHRHCWSPRGNYPADNIAGLNLLSLWFIASYISARGNRAEFSMGPLCEEGCPMIVPIAVSDRRKPTFP